MSASGGSRPATHLRRLVEHPLGRSRLRRSARSRARMEERVARRWGAGESKCSPVPSRVEVQLRLSGGLPPLYRRLPPLQPNFRKCPRRHLPSSTSPPAAHRADARRNFDAVLAAAREAFGKHGHRRVAGGHRAPGRRRDRHAVPQLPDPPGPARGRLRGRDRRSSARPPATSPACRPWEAFAAWLDRFARYVRPSSRCCRRSTRTRRSSARARARCTPRRCRSSSAPRRAGEVRKDVRLDDVLRMISGMVASTYADDEQRQRVIGIALDGLRAR